MKKEEIKRYIPDADSGLTSEDVKLRMQKKLVNRTKKVVGKSYLNIFCSNIFTFFNFIGIIIFFIMLLCKSYSNMLFIVIILLNMLVGIVQEIRSKKAVEKLSIITDPTVTVVRNGTRQTISTRDVVIDDIMVLSSGKQICCDSIILDGEAEVNESILTGESDHVKKTVGDMLYSGSYVVSGNCTAYCDKVGKNNYIEQLSAKVVKAKMPNSQVMRGIMNIIKIISLIIFPLGILSFILSDEILFLLKNGVNIFTGYINHGTAVVDGTVFDITECVNKALKGMSGSIIGMIPRGLVLLTSVALAVSAYKLARKHVLVRELPCIEMLARVNTLCLDKTGTITDGSMTVEDIIPLEPVEDLTKLIMSVLAATGDENETAKALRKYIGAIDIYEATDCVPFSSSRKFSAATINGHTVALGAAEVLFKGRTDELGEAYGNLIKEGLRVLAVGISLSHSYEPADFEPVAMVVLRDTIREDAPEIIDWFKKNNVAVKVISGDNPLAVSVIAKKAGVENADKYISLYGLSDEEVAAAANEYTVFGRVTPEQKAILVRAMKKAGATVAMTGDGVNDILAMRESDCAISVGGGTDAAKSVANLVLMDNKFSSMPSVVAEGRQVVNNIQYTSTLFMMKTTMTILSTIFCLILRRTYPFEPQHLYLVEFLIIGFASFLLTLKPNHNLIKGNFISNTLKSMFPSGIAMFISVAICYAFENMLALDANQLTTVAMFSMTLTGAVGLWVMLFPFDKYNLGVGAIATVGTAACIAVFPYMLNFVSDLFGDASKTPLYVPISGYSILFIAVNVAVMSAIIIGLTALVKYMDRRARKTAESL